jgi:TetR/AcrR family transcriptional repressor of nem operon
MRLEQNILLQGLDKELSPKARLLYFLEHAKQEAKLIALQGCCIGTACQELAKEGGLLANLSAKIMMDFLLWAEAQFYALGFITEASNLSLDLMYKLQGIFLLGYAFKDLNLIIRQITLLQGNLEEGISEKKTESEAILEMA